MTENGNHPTSRSTSQVAIKSTVAVTLFLLISKVLGFIRDMVIAANFGAGTITDSYYMANSIPTMIQLGLTACITATFIPTYTRLSKRSGKRTADKFTSQMLNISILFSLLIVLLIEIFTPFVVKIFAPSFDEQSHLLTVKYLRILMPMVVFMSGVIVLQGLMNAVNSFSIPQLVSLPTNIAMVFIIIVFTSMIGDISLPIGTLIGFSLQFFFILPFALRKFRYSSSLGIRDSNIRYAFRLMLPALISTGVTEINAVVDRMLASGLSESSISAITYSNRLTAFVSGTIVTALYTVIYSRMSEFAADNNDKGHRMLKKTFHSGLTLMLCVLLPIMVVCYMFPTEIVSIVYARGEFGSEAVSITVYAFCFYLPTMFFGAIRDLITRMFFSLSDTRTPTFNGVIALVINIVLNIILVRYLELGGLALATSISIIVACGLLFNALRKKIGRLGVKHIFMDMIRLIPALLAQTAVMWVIKFLMPPGFSSLIVFIVACVIGLPVFVGTAYLTGARSIRDLVNTFLEKLSGRSRKPRD